MSTENWFSLLENMEVAKQRAKMENADKLNYTIDISILAS